MQLEDILNGVNLVICNVIELIVILCTRTMYTQVGLLQYINFVTLTLIPFLRVAPWYTTQTQYFL